MRRLAHIRRRIAHLSAKANTRSGHAPRSGDAVERAFAPDLSGHGVRPPPTQRSAGALRRIMVKAATTAAEKAATKSVYKLERAKIAKARAAARRAKKANEKKQAKASKKEQAK